MLLVEQAIRNSKRMLREAHPELRAVRRSTVAYAQQAIRDRARRLEIDRLRRAISGE
jgi:flagellar motor switch protein FliG